MAWTAAAPTWLAVGLRHGLVGYPGRAPSAAYGLLVALTGVGAAIVLAAALWAIARMFQRARPPLLPFATLVALAQVTLVLELVGALMLL